MGIIISLLIMWLMFKILQWAFSSLSDSNNDKETSNHDDGAIDSNSNEEPSSYNVGDVDSNNKETANQTVGTIDDKPLTIDIEPPDLKYNNEVYISFRNKVRKAYESLKKSEYRISWESDMDGFVIVENDSPLIGDTVYAVNVRHDDQKLLELNNPFYIVVSYGIIFDRRYYNDYKEKADYLNDCETIKPNIYYSVDTIKGTNFGIYYANIVATNNKYICKYTEELGEAELFKRLMNMAKQAWYEGLQIYGYKIRNTKSSFLSGSNSDKENYSQILEATDEKPSDLKYKNEVYISFRNIVQKAYEKYKKIGCTIAWDSENDGFIWYGNDSLSDGNSIYNAKVRYDSRNFLKLNDPFYIHVQYGIVFDRRNCNDYEEKADYLNEETEIPSTFYNVETIEGTNFGVHYANFIVSNNEKICEDAKELGELLLFERLFSAAKEAYYDGEEIYNAKIRSEKNFSN